VQRDFSQSTERSLLGKWVHLGKIFPPHDFFGLGPWREKLPLEIFFLEEDLFGIGLKESKIFAPFWRGSREF